MSRLESFGAYALTIGLIFLFAYGLMAGREYIALKEMKDPHVTIIESAEHTPIIESITQAKAASYSAESGALLGVFTADEGKSIGDNWFKFRNARMIQFYPETRAMKSEMSADTAKIQIVDGVMADSSWDGNIRVKQYGEKANGNSKTPNP